MGIEPRSTIAILNDLIEILRDGQEGFRDAAEHVQDKDLKIALMDYSLQRARFLGELQNEIERLGEPDPENSGTLAGSLHRGWMDLKAALSSKRDEVILQECERGEDAAIESYGKALRETLPRYIRDILESQLQQIGLVRGNINQWKRAFSHA